MGNCGSNNTTINDKYGMITSHWSEMTKMSPHSLHNGSILGLSYAGGKLAVASDNKEISIHELSKLLTDDSYRGIYLRGHDKAVNRVSFNQTGNLWSASRDLSIRMWNTTSGENSVTIPQAHTLNVSAILCPSAPSMATHVFSGSRDYAVKGWDVESSQCIVEYRVPRNIVTTLTDKASDPNLIYQGSEDLCVRVWDVREKSSVPAVHITGFVYFPLCMTTQHDGNILATGCKGFNSVGCGVMLWDLRNTSKPLTELKGHTQDVTGCQFNPSNSNILTSVSKDGSVHVWDMEKLISVANYQFPKKWVSSIAVCDGMDGKDTHSSEIIVGALDGSISVLNYSRLGGLKFSFTTQGIDQEDFSEDN